MEVLDYSLLGKKIDYSQNKNIQKIDFFTTKVYQKIYQILSNSRTHYSQDFFSVHILGYTNFQDFFNEQIVANYLKKTKKTKRHIGASDKNTFFFYQNRDNLFLIQQLSTQLPPLKKTHIVAIPVYAGEDHIDTLISTLLKQEDQKTEYLLYLNAPQNFCKEKFFQVKDQLHTLKNQNPNIHIVSHIYPEKQTIAKIRADMISTIIAKHDDIKNTIVSGLDADTYKLSENFFENIRKTFEKNPDICRSAVHLKWSEKSNHPAAWLSEFLMQIECEGGVMNADNCRSPHAFGAVTSFRLADYIFCGGYHVELEKFEDLDLGMHMKKTCNKSTKFCDATVRVDPRRGIDTISKGATFGDQWNGDFLPINQKTVAKQQLDTLCHALFYGKKLSSGEISLLEKFIAEHFRYELTWSSAKQAFIDYWKNKETLSLYTLKRKNSRIKIIEK